MLVKNLDFGVVVFSLKNNYLARRAGWNGVNMFIIQVNSSGFGDNSKIPIGESRPFIMMYDAQGMYVPWLASQTDILAEDWEVSDSYRFSKVDHEETI
jgi:hypothetical protein